MRSTLSNSTDSGKTKQNSDKSLEAHNVILLSRAH